MTEERLQAISAAIEAELPNWKYGWISREQVVELLTEVRRLHRLLKDEGKDPEVATPQTLQQATSQHDLRFHKDAFALVWPTIPRSTAQAGPEIKITRSTSPRYEVVLVSQNRESTIAQGPLEFCEEYIHDSAAFCAQDQRLEMRPLGSADGRP